MSDGHGHGLEVVERIPELPSGSADAHKGTFGTVAVLAGRDGMLGAAILSARAALRGGAGLVRVVLEGRDLRAAVAAAVPAATSVDREGPPTTWFGGADAVVAGPGLGTDARGLLALDGLWAEAPSVGRVVLDADALNMLAEGTAGAARPPLPCAAVWTPHPGEAGRLLGCPAADVQADRPAAVRALAELAATRSGPGSVAVLKGAGTLVCDGRRLFENRTGNPGLGTGGSGDVLSGLLGALLARGLEPFAAACLGVHVHGAAGDLVAAQRSRTGLVAEDLPEAIAAVFGRLERGGEDR